MEEKLLELFGKLPGTLPLYYAIEARMKTELGEFTTKVSKTQVSFKNKYGFAYVSLPVRRVKGWPDVCVLVTFGLPSKVEHPRIAVAVEPYPNHWTHHVIVATEADIDEQLMDWLKQSYSFSLVK